MLLSSNNKQYRGGETIEENINKLMKSNTKISKAGYQLAEIIWACETRAELGHLKRTMDSILPKKYEQLNTLKEIKDSQVDLKR